MLLLPLLGPILVLHGLQVAAAGCEAATHYRLFLDMFKVDGKVPDKIDADNEHHYVLACLSLGRVLHRSTGNHDRWV